MATTRRTRTNTHRRALALAVGAALLPFCLPDTALAETAANAVPTHGTYVAGDGRILPVTPENYLRIEQASLKGIINWGSFSIGSAAHAHFQHDAGRQGLTLNRVIGNGASEIFGRLTSNGQLFLVNNAGVLFAPGARVEVGSLFATSLSINDQDFLAGRYQFYNPGNAGSVVNQGNIVTPNGYTALAGPQVRNDGIIVGRAGSVALAAADRVSLDMIGDGLISISVDQAALNASVINTGAIEADGGTVVLTARSANALLDTVINSSGIIRANSLVERNGEIVLDGGSAGVVAVSGTLQAAGVDSGTVGGTVQVLGDTVALVNGARIDASGDAGGGTVLIGGNYQGSGPEQNASLTIVGNDVGINAHAVTSGNGGKVIVWAEGDTHFYGTISARGGAESGDGGFAEVSGKRYLAYRGRADLTAPRGKVGTLLLDPLTLTITGGSGDGDNDTSNLTFDSLDGLLNVGTGGSTVGGDVSTVFETEIEAQSTTANIVLEATNSVTTTGTFTNNDVLLSAVGPSATGANLTIRATAANGTVDLTSGGTNSTLEFRTQGTGTILVEGGTAGTGTVTVGQLTSANGAITVNAGADITVKTGVTSTGSTVSLNFGQGTGGGALDLSAATSVSGTTATATGGGNTDTLLGKNADSSWNIDGTNQYVSTDALNFSGIEQLTGGSGADTFNVTGPHTGNLSGGLGNDSFNLTALVTGNVNGGGGSDTLQGMQIGSTTLTASTAVDGFSGTTTGVTGFSGINVLNGSGTLTGRDGVSTWSVDGGTYSDGTATLTHSGFGALQGGTAIDTFNLGAAATKNLAGGGGVDVFALAGNTLSGTIDGQAAGGSITGIGSATLTNQGATTGFDGTSANVSGGFSNITSLSGTGTLTGRAVASTWALDGTPTYSDGTRTLDVAGFANLQGGTDTDTFGVSAASTFNLLGGAGADVFNINAALTGSVSGETGSDALQGTQIGSTTLTASTAADGFSGTTTGLTGFSGINVLNASGTLTGRNVASTWSVDGGAYNDGTATLTHSGFGTLQGGSAIDTFNVAAASTFSLLGGDGADVFNVNAALTGSVNGEAGSDTLSGSTTYLVNVLNGGTASNVSAGFSNVENLAGTGGADSFTLAGGTLAGTVDGLGGTDTLSADNVANTWTITGVNSGTLTGTGGWLNLENLVGGNISDSFNGAGGSVAGTISDGGGGTTTLIGTITSGGNQSYTAAVSAGAVTLNAGTGSISATQAANDFTGTLDVIGSSASITDANALTIDANLTGGLTTNSGALTYVAGLSVGGLTSAASGAVTETGAITVTGATSINAGANSITLTSANDFQSTVSLTGGTTQITDANALTFGTVSVGALTTVNTGALNLGTLTAASLNSTTNNGNITQGGTATISGTAILQAGSGSIVLPIASNDFGGTISGGATGGIQMVDANNMTFGPLAGGSSQVTLIAAGDMFGPGFVSGGTGIFSSSGGADSQVIGLGITFSGNVTVTGSATLWNFTTGSTAGSFGRTSETIGVQVGGVTFLANLVQIQAGNVVGSVSAAAAAVIVEEANKTFGTDSVAEDVEYGFAGEIGATPPMDHRIDESGISLPRCVEEAREGLPCK